LNIPYYQISSQPFPPTTPTPTFKIAIVIFYDLFGFALPNCKIIADSLCEEQPSPSFNDKRIDVFIPDILLGRALPESILGPLSNPIPAARDYGQLSLG
jgi:hypothetical protein